MRWQTVLIVLALHCSFAECRVWAQGDATSAASARALFDEGVVLADSARWPEAADRFQRALSLRDSPVIRFNLASALLELNRLVEASELLRQVQRDPAAEAQLRSDAGARLALVTPRLAKLTIDLEGDFSGVSVRLDDREVAAPMIGMAMPVDPGVHQLRALRGAEEIASETVELADGGAQRVVLSAVRVALPKEAAATVMAGPVAVQTSGHDQREPGRSSTALWWGIGGGVIAVAIVTVVTLIATKDSGESTPKPYQGDFDQPSVRVQVSE